MRIPPALPAALVAIAALTPPALAQSGIFRVDPNVEFRLIQPNSPLNDVMAQNRIYLFCEVRDEKRAIIQNTTGSPTPEGKIIYLEVITIPDGQHIVEAITDRSLGVGEYIAPGIPNSSACYAWYEEEPLLLME